MNLVLDVYLPIDKQLIFSCTDLVSHKLDKFTYSFCLLFCIFFNVLYIYIYDNSISEKKAIISNIFQSVYILFPLFDVKDSRNYFSTVTYTPFHCTSIFHLKSQQYWKKIRSSVGNCFSESYFLLFQTGEVITRYTSTQMLQPIL